MAATSSTSTTTTTVSLKLLMNKATNKVIFAEADKDFVDFLFHILSLPVGTLIMLLTTKGMIGSLGNLYESLQNLNLQYVEPKFNKDYLLKPTSCSPTSLPTPLLLSNSEPHCSIQNDNQIAQKRFYRCRRSNACEDGWNNYVCKDYVSDDPTVMCPKCDNYKLSVEMKYVPSTNDGNDEEAKKMNESKGGYVKGVVSYMVMDDLSVQPMSTISSITLLSKFSIKDVSILEEKLVSFGFDEGLRLLKASLLSQTVLTDVFLSKRESTELCK